MVGAVENNDCVEIAAKRQRRFKMPSEDGNLKILDRRQYFEQMQALRKRTNPTGPPVAAMYSSLVDGTVTDPDLMMIPIDDHAIVRGHAIFDTATLKNGRVYNLSMHLDRLFASAKDARLQLPFGATEDENRKRITDIVCSTCVASGYRDGNIRYYLSAGPGNFNVTSVGCEPAFYCVVYGSKSSLDPSTPGLQGIDEVTVPVSALPMKPPLLARVKSNNYMLNALVAMKAQDSGGKLGLSIREDGSIAEGCVANCVVITADKVMITPPFGDILSGTTVRRAMAVARKHLVKEDGLLSDVRQEPLQLDAAFAASEVFMIAGDTQLWPVLRLDGRTIGTGEVGPVAAELYRLLNENAESGNDDHIELEY
eukprot:TRINITY_DN63933_c0_g1_i1.p1 TRINITY_DN63933_c0_g1~~TRINITY_DN63933_c0_g1_i1.p1  ORF type:complete len:387 (+),score=54.43 TRINITY_DN63933_c0_g1_i1:59-1162(+)